MHRDRRREVPTDDRYPVASAQLEDQGLPDNEPVPPLADRVVRPQRVDYYYTRWGGWKYRNTGAKVIAESRPFMADNEQWPGYCFVVIRTIPQKDEDKAKPPQHKFQIKSQYLLKAIKDVMKEIEGISWNSEPLEVCIQQPPLPRLIFKASVSDGTRTLFRILASVRGVPR